MIKYLTKTIDITKEHCGWIGGILGFLSPAGEIFIYLIMFVFADLITGIKASKVQKIKISSNALKRTILKLITYFSAIVLAHGLDCICSELIGTYTFMKITTGLIAFTEFISICENLYKITNLDVFYILTQLSVSKFISIFGIKPKNKKSKKSK